MKRKIINIDIIRVLMLTTALLCGANATPGERVNDSYENNRRPGTAPAFALNPAAQFYGDGLIAVSADDQIYIMNADGSNLRLLTDNNPNVRYRYPALSPDGTMIAFTRDAAEEHALYVVGIDGNNLRRLSSSTVSVAEPAWSPDGSKIAYLRGYDTTYGGLANITSCGGQIYVIDVFSGKETNLTGSAGGVDPAWSPDGTRIAFSSSRDGNFEIYTMTPQGGEVKRLTNTGGGEADPAWSPDGTQIAYTSNLPQVRVECGFMSTGRPGQGGIPGEETTSIYIMTAEGADHTQLPMTSGGMEPTWSPDGTHLALVIDAKGGFQLYVIGADGSRLQRLTSDLTQKLSPSWSGGSNPR
jgi:Tol biopolymer transport system component